MTTIRMSRITIASNAPTIPPAIAPTLDTVLTLFPLDLSTTKKVYIHNDIGGGRKFNLGGGGGLTCITISYQAHSSKRVIIGHKYWGGGGGLQP